MARKSTIITASLLLLAVAAVVLTAMLETTERVAEPPTYTVAVERDDVEEQEPPPTEAAQMPTTSPIPEREPEGELLTPSGLNAAELEAGLLGELKQYAEAFIAAERETGVNAVFLAAVAALESGWNTSEVAESKNNLFGWSAATGYASFESKEACIAEVAACVKCLYLTPDGAYFNGYTVEAVNTRYNGAEHWEKTVKQIMQEIKDRIEGSANNEQ